MSGGDLPSPTLGLQRVGRFTLESGETLTNVEQGWALLGTLSPRRDNVVLVLHSLTGAPGDLAGWYPEVIGPGKAIDTDRFAVLSPNLLGSCYGTRFVAKGAASITTRDQARLVALLLDDLGVSRVALATGGSLGGMVALEWAASFPERSETVAVFAAPAAHTAWGIGWNHVMRRAVAALGVDGLALARMAGMLVYRTPGEFETRFGRGEVEGGELAVRSYLDHHGEKLVGRFDAASYVALLDAMDAHDVGRGRGSVAEALSAYSGRLVGIGIPGDVLYPPEDVRRWTEAAGAELRFLRSTHGHDGFLLEVEDVSRLFRDLLPEPDSSASRGLARAPRAAEKEVFANIPLG
ncbi:MAG: alpha/beta fold hydrolase [Acidobacteria bacterium]|nr:alpha/beta fold hydrolase [Acidobacteriota bacterium]